MAKFKLEELFLGKNDGKKEAIFKSDFEKFFFDYDNQYEKICSKENYLLLGKKGSGKTLLAEYVKRKSKRTTVSGFYLQSSVIFEK